MSHTHCYCISWSKYLWVLSRASEVGSPTNHLGSRQRRDTGQGPLNLMTDYLEFKNTDWLWTCVTKAGWAWHATIDIFFHFQVYVFILKPSTLFCYITHFGFNLTITLIYAPLLVKTTRVYRIFAASENFDRELRCVSLSSQLFITWIVCVMQVGPQFCNIFILL